MINWNKYCDHIYFLHLQNSNEKSFNNTLKNINLYENPILSIEYYIIDKNFNDYKYFKSMKVLDCIANAYYNQYNNIIIFKDDLLFENEETINNILLECQNKDISILNPNDICEDILFINQKVINFICNNHINIKSDNWNTLLKEEINNNFNIYRTSNCICTHKIDYIFPYVDSSDPEWQRGFLKYYNKEKHEVYNQKCRWSRFDNLIYVIRSIAKNLSWINNLFIIVESETQIPKWLIKDNIKIVYHKDFIPEKFLPTYNVNPIESFLYNINELSEYFLYANDDMFIIKPLSKKSFFENGHTKNILIDNILDRTNYEQICNNSCDVINLEFKKEIIKYKRCIHTPHAMIKSHCMHIGIYHKDILYKTITKFRNNNNVNQYMNVIYEMMIDNNQEDQTTKTIHIDLTSPFINYKELRKFHILGIKNTSENLYKIDELNLYFHKKFPTKSKYDNYVKPRKIKKNNNDKIYVSFTSWKARIDDCYNIFKMMLNQTLLPTKIILNLAEEEFTNKEKDLPQNLVNLVNQNNLCEIYWVKKNYKTFKKIIHTLNRYPNDIIITIDDDIPYPNNFIEVLYKDYMKIHRNSPISYSNYVDKNGFHTHYGGYTITEFKFYGELLNQVLEEFVYSRYDNNYKCFDDNIYTEVAKLNGYTYIQGSINYNKDRLKIHKFTKNAISERTPTYELDIKKYNDELITYLKKYYKYQLDNKLIISLTSYPARISYVKDALMSLVNQSIDWKYYHIVLVLSIEEFPNKENDLPKNLVKYITDYKDLIEILWCEKNIKSHKKLMPTLKKYPNNPILVCDDDVYRPNGWVKMFIEDHIKYPKDIIFGASGSYFGENLKLENFKTFKCKKIGPINGIPNQIFKSARPANGFGGCLYPANTFTDERFFDEELMMKLCPTSDESWQYCFNIIENKTFRQSSKIYDYSKYFIKDSQKVKTSLGYINDYKKINDILFDKFTIFKQMLILRINEFIISLTSHSVRIKYLPRVLNSLFKQTVKPHKIVITIYKEDIKYITNELYEIFKKPIIDLIISNENLGPHLKYFYAMQKYKNYAVITIDDDVMYSNDLCESLIKSYNKYPDMISARRMHYINRNYNGIALKYNKWTKNINIDYNTINLDNNNLFITGCGGVIYPPDILKLSDRNIDEIYNCLYADDIYLKWLENKMNIQLHFCKWDNIYGNHINDIDEINQSALCLENTKTIGENRNDKYLKIFEV